MKKNYLILLNFLPVLILILSIVVESHVLFLYSSIFIAIVIAITQVKIQGPLKPSSIVLLTALPYFLTVIFNLNLYYNHSEYLSLKLLTIYCIIFFLFYIVFDTTMSNIKIPNFTFGAKSNSKIIFIFYLLSVLIYIYLVFSLFTLSIGSLSRADIYKSKSTSFDVYKLFTYSFSVFYLWFIFCVKRNKGKNLLIWLIPITAFLITDILILGDRKFGIVVFLIGLYIYSNFYKIKAKYWILGLILGVGLWIFGYLRNTSIDNWYEVLVSLDYEQVFSPDKSEFGAFSIVWMEYFSKYSTVGLKPTYLESIIQLIPSAIYSNRPLSPSVSFVKEFHPDIYEAGGGLAFNAILESLMNFYVLGPVIFSLLLVFLSKFYKQNQFGILLGAVFIFCFSFNLRNDMISNLRTLIFCLSIVTLNILLFCKVYINRKVS